MRLNIIKLSVYGNDLLQIYYLYYILFSLKYEFKYFMKINKSGLRI